MARSTRPITVTLGDLQEKVEARVASGAYASASEVVRAGLRALDREEAVLEAWLRKLVDEGLDDGQPGVSAKDVFAELRARNAAWTAKK